VSYKYGAGYKYQLKDEVRHRLWLDMGLDTKGNQFVCIEGGYLIIKPGYAWDGPSGPVIDRGSTMYPSLIHDALYQLIREGHMHIRYRDRCDKEFALLCKNRGVWSIWTRGYYRTLKAFGKSAATKAAKLFTME